MGKLTHAKMMWICLPVGTWIAPMDLYKDIKARFDITVSYSTWEREFRKWRAKFPKKSKEKEFAAESGVMYKKFQKG